MLIDYMKKSYVGLVREYNQDYAEVFSVDNGLLAINCDGVGGESAGEFASRLAVEIVYHYFSTAKYETPFQRIGSALHHANYELLKTADGNEYLAGMATTSDVLFLRGKNVVFGHVGDSRIYYFANGQLYQITKDHSLVQKLVDSGLITEEIAQNHPQKNVILKALGNKPELQADVFQFTVDEETPWKFFMCTDGVSGVVSNEEIRALLKSDNLSYIDYEINRLVEQRGAPDNYTYIILSNIVK